MAEEPRSLELLLQCQVCFEEFTGDGDHVPRLLPCTHTVCHLCVGLLIRENKLDCPECRTKHRATNKEKSFPQNKYLLTVMKRKTSNEQATPNEFLKCEDHGEDLNMYCGEPECRKAVCRICLRTEHKGHVAFPIEEQEKDVLLKDLKKIKWNLEAKLEMISEARKDIGNRTRVIIEEINGKKDEFNRHFEKMVKEAEGQNRQAHMLIDNEVSAMSSNLDLLRSLQQRVENDEVMRYEEIMNNQETVRGITENNSKNLSGERSYGYPKYIQFSRGDLLGRITREQLKISLPELEDPEEITDQLPRTITNASQCQWKVTSSIKTGIDIIRSITLLQDHIAVICGEENGLTKLKSYDLHNGAQLNCLNRDEAFGLAEVKIGGKSALAVSLRYEQTIEFRDANYLARILYTHSVAPHEPGVMCTGATPSILLFVDASKNPREVHWLDLSGEQPKPAAGKNIIRIRKMFMDDICFVQWGKRQLLVVVAAAENEADDSDDEVFAYNTVRDQLEWKADDKPLGMEKRMKATGATADGRGHLFVGDWMYGNQCIQMFSVSDGKYLGCLTRDGQRIRNLYAGRTMIDVKEMRGMGHPGKLYWCEKTSSLLSAYSWDGKWHLKVITVQC